MIVDGLREREATDKFGALFGYEYYWWASQAVTRSADPWIRHYSSLRRSNGVGSGTHMWNVTTHGRVLSGSPILREGSTLVLIREDGGTKTRTRTTKNITYYMYMYMYMY